MITYSINAHPVIALMFGQTGTDVLPRRDEGSDKPSATIEPHTVAYRGGGGAEGAIRPGKGAAKKGKKKKEKKKKRKKGKKEKRKIGKSM